MDVYRFISIWRYIRVLDLQWQTALGHVEMNAGEAQLSIWSGLCLSLCLLRMSRSPADIGSSAYMLWDVLLVRSSTGIPAEESISQQAWSDVRIS